MENNFEVIKLTDGQIKDLLWKVVYKPSEVTSEIPAGINPEEFIDILYSEKERRNIKFGEREPVLDTKGIDLCIKNPLVRDVIIERSYKAVFEEDHNIEKAVKLLKSQEENWPLEKYLSRLHGGLSEIGFSKEEANYLKETCNLYPIGLMIDRLEKSLGGEEYIRYTQSSSFKQNNNDIGSTPNEEELTASDLIPVVSEVEEKQQVNVSVQDLIANAAEIKELLNLKKKLEVLFGSLAHIGITPEYVAERSAYLNDFYNAVENLNS